MTTAALVLAGCGAGGTTNTSPATGDDPVFAAIDAALAQYPGGVIDSIDREDRRDVYDIVTNGTVTEIEVSDNGDIREEELDDDDRATLEWQIDLDDENRRDLAEVRIPAN